MQHLSHKQIIERKLGTALSATNTSHCPCREWHTSPSRATDCQWYFEDSKPHCHCLHSSCSDALSEYISRLYSELNRIRRSTLRPEDLASSYHSPRPIKHAPTSPEPFNAELAERIAAGYPHNISYDDLRACSPISIPSDPQAQALKFFSHSYGSTDNILIFTNPLSQGDYIWRGLNQQLYQLAPQPNKKASPISSLPMSAANGMYYLISPVTGRWRSRENAKPSRRCGTCATRYPYALIESDCLPAATWLRILAQLEDRIQAIYLSGSKSIHALISVLPDTLDNFATVKYSLAHRLRPVGADHKALSAIRLSRLPGAYRESTGQRQELLWLNAPSNQGTLKHALAKIHPQPQHEAP